MNIKKIWFYTASFGILPAKDYALCELIERSGLKISWKVPVRMDTVLKFPDLIKKSAAAGMKLALIGFESSGNEALTAPGKTKGPLYNHANFKKAYHILRRNNILVEGSFIIGYPGELEEESMSLKKINQLCDFVTIQVYRPNVALLPEILSKGPENKDYKRLFYFSPHSSDDVNVKQALKKKKKILYKYYLHPFYIYLRFFSGRTLLRRLYLYFYAHIIKNIFKKAIFVITRREARRHRYLIRDL